MTASIIGSDLAQDAKQTGIGAGEGNRTLDIQLGKLTFYL
jgi:hypothetical protein